MATTGEPAGESSGSTPGASGSTGAGSSSEGTGGSPTTGGESGTTSAGSVGGSLSGDSSTGAGESSSSGGESPCEELELTVQTVPPNVVLVLDKSSSMVTAPGGTWDGDGDPNTPPVTRWSSLYQALDGSIGKYAVNLGTKLFPAESAKDSGDGQACLVDAGVEVPVMPMNKAAILAGIPGPDDLTLAGATPMTAAVSSALGHLQGLDPAVPRALILVTNGAANCATESMGPELFEVYDEQVHAIVAAAWQNDGIPTHVVGLAITDEVSPDALDGVPDGINLRDKLNDLALAGGKPAPGEELFNNAADAIELTEIFNLLLFDSLGCRLPLPQEPAFPDDTEVVVAGVKLPHIEDCAGEHGWRFLNEQGPFTAIEVCGAPCYDLKFAGEASVRFYCSAG